MIIYLLFVVYNTEFKIMEEFADLPAVFKIVVFDNSTDAETFQKNKKYCEINNIFYDTEGRNAGLSKAYNIIITKYLSDDDWLLIMDSDTNITREYLNKCSEAVKDSISEVFTPINIDSKDGRIDSPKLISNGKMFKTQDVDLSTDSYDYFMSINNGLLIKNTVFKKVGLYDERIFLYFTDSYFFFMLKQKSIKTEVIPYHNLCDFSFSHLNNKGLLKKLGMMKRDGKEFYRIAYKALGNSFLGWIHYHLFFFKKAIECAKLTGKRHFLSYLFVRKAKI